MKDFLKKVGAGAVAVIASGAAMAQPSGSTVDVAQVVSTINGGLAAVGAIGVAILGIAAVVAIYNWVKRPIK